MAASDNLHPQQLQMFMRPSELLGKVEGVVDAMPDQSTDDVMDYKYGHAQRRRTGGGRTLAESIRSEGIRKPVILTPGDTRNQALAWRESRASRSDHFWLGNGHHRVATAAALEKEGVDIHVPVIYDHDYMGSRETRNTFGVAED